VSRRLSIEARLATLRQEAAEGAALYTTLRQRQRALRRTLDRIAGAIEVLEAQLREEPPHA
jgi:hypothetical protein